MKSTIIVSLRSEFDRQKLPRSIMAAVLLFVIEAILAISLTALVFKGSLSTALPYGIALSLAGQAIPLITINLLSSYSGAVATIQDPPVVILALAVPIAVAAMPKTADVDQVFSTILALIIGTSLLTGLAFLLVGVFKLGEGLVSARVPAREITYPDGDIPPLLYGAVMIFFNRNGKVIETTRRTFSRCR